MFFENTGKIIAYIYFNRNKKLEIMKTKLDTPKNLQGSVSSKGNKNAGFDFALLMLGVKFIPMSLEKTISK